MNTINEVFESVYSGITEFEKKYFKTHGRYFGTDTVIAFGGFKEALQYKDPEIKKLRDASKILVDLVLETKPDLIYSEKKVYRSGRDQKLIVAIMNLQQALMDSE